MSTEAALPSGISSDLFIVQAIDDLDIPGYRLRRLSGMCYPTGKIACRNGEQTARRFDGRK